MAEPIFESIGLLAAALTTSCWVPQTLRILRTRDARSISLWSQSVLAIGTVLWVAYGVAIMSWPIIGSNTLTLCLVCSIIGLKIRFSGHPVEDQKAAKTPTAPEPGAAARLSQT